MSGAWSARGVGLRDSQRGPGSLGLGGGKFFFLTPFLPAKVSPVLVETNPLKSGLLVVSPEDLAWQALDTLGLTSQTPECLRHAVQVLSWGNPSQRAGCDRPWPGSTSPQKGGNLQRRGGPPPRAGEPGGEMGNSRMGGVLIFGTSPSQGFLLTIFLSSWFFLSRWGLKLLSLLVSWNRARFLRNRT